ncbi:neutral zinc metallopeptidase [Actinomadura parmotrematis]|uniref:neutral zinc metallopeptidase n=1 Tax=Actinomadura parmotrematis TaxID=2864039 RepID=UPI0027E2359F|nr:neutral zinc metallopeptidase [Actinomadura parmotrematis]
MIGGVLALVAIVGVLGVLGLAAIGRSASAGSSAGTGASGGSRGTSGNRAPTGRAAAYDSRLYTSGPLAARGCRLPAIGAASASMNRFMNTLSDCLDASWAAQFGKIGISFRPPRRVFWLTPGSSPCGNYPAPGASAFYCPANNSMYVGLRDVVKTSANEPLSHYAVFARVIAHEYGHHVQDAAGILEYAHSAPAASTEAARNEASRRIELQAQCLAGAFLGSERDTLPMTQAQYAYMINDVRGRGDDDKAPDERDHGLARHYAGWVVQGFKGRGLGVCNTWSAPASEVS